MSNQVKQKLSEVSPDFVMATKHFSTYQINRQKLNNFEVQDADGKKSLQELKIAKKKITRNEDKYNELPGVNVSLLDENENIQSKGDLDRAITQEQQQVADLESLGPVEKARYWTLLVAFSMCRGSLSPLMTAIPEPVVYKLVWRSILVDL